MVWCRRGIEGRLMGVVFGYWSDGCFQSDLDSDCGCGDWSGRDGGGQV